MRSAKSSRQFNGDAFFPRIEATTSTKAHAIHPSGRHGPSLVPVHRLNNKWDERFKMVKVPQSTTTLGLCIATRNNSSTITSVSGQIYSFAPPTTAVSIFAPPRKTKCQTTSYHHQSSSDGWEDNHFRWSNVARPLHAIHPRHGGQK